MDLCFVPGYPHTLSTISGCAEVAIFDLEKVQKIAFSSHQKSVRAISFFPEQSNYFVTGGRDGHIFVWDLRVLGNTYKNNCHDQITIVTKPHGTILNAHLSRDSTNHRRSTYVAEEVNGITSLAHLDEFSVASSSAKSKTGIYIWDIRYQKPEKPLRILHIPPGTSQKQTGISFLSVDRFGSQLFAVCTDNRILVYEAQSNCNNPGI
uniref:Uncharacterized protein n=1 Tax=Acrobeloides nanus TaxID=290746 RepID=A0A914CZG7_9BILA